MTSGQETYTDMYSRKDTDKLLSLYNAGGLTPEAYDDLESVLRSRGVELSNRPTPAEDRFEKHSSVGWGGFSARFVGAFVLCVAARRIFLSHLPNPAHVMPGSLKDIVGRLFGDSV